jgi:hypothetical protein
MKLSSVVFVVYVLGAVAAYGYDLGAVTRERAVEACFGCPAPEFSAFMRAIFWPATKPLAASAWLWGR